MSASKNQGNVILEMASLKYEKKKKIVNKFRVQNICQAGCMYYIYIYIYIYIYTHTHKRERNEVYI